MNNLRHYPIPAKVSCNGTKQTIFCYVQTTKSIVNNSTNLRQGIKAGTSPGVSQKLGFRALPWKYLTLSAEKCQRRHVIILVRRHRRLWHRPFDYSQSSKQNESLWNRKIPCYQIYLQYHLVLCLQREIQSVMNSVNKQLILTVGIKTSHQSSRRCGAV